MSHLARMTRQTLTVARRDFVATVFTPTFLIFLLAPLIMASFGAIGGLGAASVADGAAERMRIVALADAVDAPALIAADARLRRVFRDSEAPPALVVTAATGDAAAQARALFERRPGETTAVLYGPPAHARILYAPPSRRHAVYLGEVASEAYLGRLAEQTVRRLGPEAALREPVIAPVTAARTSVGGRGQAAFFTVFGIFFLTLMLAGQAVGTMAEERSNKVIEVLAAAVPLESVFLGKLIGMFGVAVLFVGFWATIVFNVGQFLPAEMARAFAGARPAIGLPAFALLFLAYFTLAYMLLGAVFLGVGAQASTPREIQMLSLPITIFQVAMFGLSQVAASKPDAALARVAEVFPFSSPFAMAARAANRPELWPHALAIGWQLLWVAITIWVGAYLFRRGVLQSGGPAFWKRGRTAPGNAAT